MAVRVRFIYLLFIILISLSFLSCEGGDYNFGPIPLTTPFDESPDNPPDFPRCDEGMRPCGEECIPTEATCCSDINNNLIHGCPLDERVCCVDGKDPRRTKG